MLHSTTRDPRRIAVALLDFARSSAESRLIAITGSVSTPVPLKRCDAVTVTLDDDTIVLIGMGRDAAYEDVDQDRLQAMIASGRAVVQCGALVFPINGPASASRPNPDVFVLEAEHRRVNGRPSGSIGRLVLIVDRAAGVVIHESRPGSMTLEG